MRNRWIDCIGSIQTNGGVLFEQQKKQLAVDGRRENTKITVGYRNSFVATKAECETFSVG